MNKRTPTLVSLCVGLLAGSVWPALAGELHVWTSEPAGFNTHSVWYDDGFEVTVVDTQFTPAIAEKLIADIHKETRSPITRVIVTHPNPDKFNATAVFHNAGAESIASAATAASLPGVDAYKRNFWVKVAKSFSEETYPRPEPIQTTFSGRTTIKLKSGETITLIELARPGISSTQTIVRFDATGDLAVGDLVHYKTHAWLEGGIVNGKPKPDLEGWKADLKELPGLAKGRVYGGRGEFAPVEEAVAAQITYLDKADTIVADYLNALGDNAKAEFDDGARAQQHYALIRDAVAKAFPDYAMPDLVSYSVYGLMMQKLAAR
ncbi:MBL fold metallo-hydrolase [Rhizobium sullae]|uniref:Glyoxylase-like metal-dependent hydrolase (Beta-lactamase superfamily II) n=1 Tax=Rhizobium sullae TaxID=50338 RepID=A0A4V2V8W1_RHISU|nr:MBL fold metallo-hydrolase [Rhizobium sullae]TCU14825.1 glyoxylase-like metal-dependent hydrolase (beta-lactamase superfamily II) [Rhizobium sullae]